MANHKKEPIKPKASSPEKSHLPYILIVEDEPTHVAVMSHTIRSANPNAVVKVAGSLKEYRSIIAISSPEIVLIDMHLPDGKALEVLTSPLEAGLFPIVVITSSGDEKIAVKAIKAGALDYVVKSTEALKAMPHTIERALREWKLIQDRKQAEEELRESELRFRSLYENVAVGLYRTTPAGKILLANRALVKMLGYSSFEKLAERNLTKAGFAQSSQRKEFLKKIETESEINDYESEWTRQDDSVLFVRESARAIRDSQGKTLYYDGAAEDITESRLAKLASKHAENALRESEDKFKYMFDDSPVGKSITLTSGEINVNNAFCDMLGYTQGELQYKKWQEITCSEDIEITQRQIDSLVSDERESVRFVKRFIHKNGSVVWVDLSASLCRDENDKPLYIITTISDITERKKAEEELSRTKNVLEQSFEQSPTPMVLVSMPDAILRIINPASREFLGMMDEPSYIGTSLMNYEPTYKDYDAHGNIGNVKNLPLARALAGQITINEERRIIRKDGTIRWALVSGAPIYINIGEIIAGYLSMNDITERKQAEVAAKENQERLALVLQGGDLGTWDWNVQTGKVSFDDRWAQMLGYKVQELEPDVRTWESLVHPDDMPYVREMLNAHLEGRTAFYETEHRLRHKSGSWVWALDKGKVIVRDATGKALRVAGTRLDITERKRAEEALRESEAKLKKAQQYAHIGSWSWNITTNQLEWSDEMFHIFGIEKENFSGTISEVIAKAIHPDDRAKVEQSNLSVINDRKPIPLEYRIIWPDQSIHTVWAEAGELIIDTAGNPFLLNGVVQDITERKRAEEALRRSEVNLQLAMEAARLGDWSWDIVTGEIIWSSQCKALYGLSPETVMTYEKLLERIHPDDRDRIDAALKQAVETKGDYNVEKRVVWSDGSEHWNASRGRVFCNAAGEPVRLAGITHDITERKRTEEALQKSHDMIVKLTAQVPGVVYQYRLYPDGRSSFPFASHGMNDIYEVTPEDVREDASPVFGRLHPDDNDRVVVSIQESARTLQPFHCEFRVVLPRQGLRWRLSDALPERMEDGSTLWHGIISDITDRKITEQALRESQALYHSLVEQLPAGVFRKDPEGRYVFVSSWFCQLKNMKPDEFLGKTPQEAAACEAAKQGTMGQAIKYAAEGENHHRLIMQNGKPIELDEEYTDADGKKQFVHAIKMPVINSDGKIIGTQGILFDSTELKRAEQDIRKLSSAVEQSGSSIVMTNLKGDIEYVNPKFVEITGYSIQEAIGKNPRILKSGDTTSEEYKNLWSIITNGGVWQGEFHNKKKNGELYWESAIISPVRDSDGRITHFIGVKEDITQQKAIAEQLRQMQKMEGLGTLAGGIAHDFNNILGIILAYITSIKRFKGDTKKLDLAVETISKAVDRGKTLVQQILTFARKTEIEFGAVNVNDVVTEIMTMIMETFPKILTYAQNFDKGIPYFNADRSQLHQALLNLCVNARDAMPNGGVLSINTRMVSVAHMRRQYPDAAASSYVCIEVNDTGEGMTEETQKRVFEPFFTTKGIGKGTGLGLAVVFGVVQTHKGFIDVESELGKGTTFRLYLPASQVTEPISINDEETLENIPGGTETVMVVEDEEMLMMSLRMVLVEKGYNVLSAEDGLMALKVYQERKNDIALVLTDLGLPAITGLEVCQRIKKINPNQHMILATGFLDPEMKSEFLKAGIQHFLYKPYNLTKVLKVIREVIDKK